MTVPIRFMSALALLPYLALSAPVETLGSKHTFFLATCAPADCPIGLCDPGDFNIGGAGYFINGPPSGNTASATAFARVAASQRWEGAARSVSVSQYGTLKTSIDAKAASLAQGEIAGSATLSAKPTDANGEPFICFKDGVTKFTTTYDFDKYTCTATYYCPSIDAGITTLPTTLRDDEVTNKRS